MSVIHRPASEINSKNHSGPKDAAGVNDIDPSDKTPSFNPARTQTDVRAIRSEYKLGSSDSESPDHDADEGKFAIADAHASNGSTGPSSHAGENGSSMSSDAQPASGFAAQIKRSAQDLVSAEVEKQAGRGAENLSDVAKALRETSRGLENNVVSPYVERAADQIDRVSNFLQNAKPQGLLQDVASFARRKPWLFLAGAFAVGIIGARFFKSARRGSDDVQAYTPTAASQRAAPGRQSGGTAEFNPSANRQGNNKSQSKPRSS